MRKKMVLAMIFILGLTTNALADLVQNQVVSTATQVLRIFNQDYNGDKQLPKRFTRDRIKAIAIIPDLVKGGVIASGQSGKGIFCLKNADGTWSDPLFVQLRGFGIGAQIGYQSTDAILLFDNTRSYSGIFKGTDTIDVGAEGTVGGGHSVSHMTDLPDIAANIYAIGRSNGVFIGMSIDNSHLSVEDEANIDYYGRIFRNEDIINGSPRDTKYTKDLKKALRTTFNK